MEFKPNKANDNVTDVAKAECQVAIWTVEKIDGPAEVIESKDTTDFTCKLTPDTLPEGVTATYKWLDGTANGVWPSGVGNAPSSLNYEKPTEKTTKIKDIQWFASPNDAYTHKHDCNYKINCEVTIEGETAKASSPANLRVYFPKVQGRDGWGVCYSAHKIQGDYSTVIEDGPDDKRFVKYQGIGTVTLTNSNSYDYGPPPESQFRPKLVAHETTHGTQANTIIANYDIDKYMQGKTYEIKEDETDAEARIAFGDKYHDEIIADIDANDPLCAREREAFDAGDRADPSFPYIKITNDGIEAFYKCKF